MKKESNIICSCGAKYRYDGLVNQGALYCFVCGKELILSNRHHKELVNTIKVNLLK